MPVVTEYRLRSGLEMPVVPELHLGSGLEIPDDHGPGL